MLPHQHHDDGDEEEVQGREGEDDRMLPVELKHVLLPLLSLLPLLTLEWTKEGQAGAGGGVMGLVRRAGVGRGTEALAGLVIPDSTHLQAVGRRLGVLALAAARLLPPLLVFRPAAGRLKAASTPTSNLCVNSKLGWNF